MNLDPDTLWGKGDSHSSSFLYHHLEITSQSIKSTVERCSYILHDSSISRDHHLLCKRPAPGRAFCVSYVWKKDKRKDKSSNQFAAGSMCKSFCPFADKLYRSSNKAKLLYNTEYGLSCLQLKFKWIVMLHRRS